MWSRGPQDWSLIPQWCSPGSHKRHNVAKPQKPGSNTHFSYSNPGIMFRLKHQTDTSSLKCAFLQPATLTIPSRHLSDVPTLYLQPCGAQSALIGWRDHCPLCSPPCRPALTCLQVWQGSFTVRSDVVLSLHTFFTQIQSQMEREKVRQPASSVLWTWFLWLFVLTHRMRSLVL